MFEVFKKRKDRKSERTIDLFIDAPIYEELRKRALKDGVSENEEVLRALRRGMDDYRLYMAKAYGEDYEVTLKLFQRYRKDNELFRKIMDQNEKYYELLKRREKRERIWHRK